MATPKSHPSDTCPLKLEKDETIPTSKSEDSIPETSAVDNNILKELFELLDLKTDQIEKLNELNCCKFPCSSEWSIGPSGEVKTATFNQLILHLTSPDTPNLEFQEQFLITFPSFASPKIVLAAIFTRFFPDFSQPNCNIPDTKYLKSVRDRIIRIISTWIKLTQYQFDKDMIAALEKFKDALSEDPATLCYLKIIDAALAHFYGRDRGLTYTIKQAPPIQLPSGDPLHWTLMETPPVEVARQVTLYHSSLFQSIGTTELLTEVWGEGKTGGSPHINQLIDHFNKFADFVTLSVLLPTILSERITLHSHWIDVASEFLEMRNFHGMFAVIFGLTHRAVSRLKQTVEGSMKTSKARKNAFLKMQEICSINRDFFTYRDIISKASEPCVPYIGILQKDLIYVQETYPNSYEGCVNFEKCRHCVTLLKSIERFQYERYPFQSNDRLQELARQLPPCQDLTLLMQFSMQREPKKK